MLGFLYWVSAIPLFQITDLFRCIIYALAVRRQDIDWHATSYWLRFQLPALGNDRRWVTFQIHHLTRALRNLFNYTEDNLMERICKELDNEWRVTSEYKEITRNVSGADQINAILVTKRKRFVFYYHAIFDILSLMYICSNRDR